MPKTKRINLCCDRQNFRSSVDITSDMSEAEVYLKIRAECSQILLRFSEILIYNRHGQLAQLRYNHLKGGQCYNVTPYPKRRQATVNASKRTLSAISKVVKNWVLEGDGGHNILPPTIAPRETKDGVKVTVEILQGNCTIPLQKPELWSKNLAEELVRLSCVSKGRHAEAVELLSQAVGRRHANDGVGATAELVLADVRFVKENWEVLKKGMEENGDDVGEGRVAKTFEIAVLESKPQDVEMEEEMEGSSQNKAWEYR